MHLSKAKSLQLFFFRNFIISFISLKLDAPVEIIIGLSDNFENDRQILKSNIENAISKRLNAEDFALKSILESMLLSKSCEVAKSDADKALSLGGGPDVYTALGAMYSGCGDLTSSIKFSSMALELTPNDNGWLITNNLVSALYRLG